MKPSTRPGLLRLLSPRTRASRSLYYLSPRLTTTRTIKVSSAASDLDSTDTSGTSTPSQPQKVPLPLPEPPQEDSATVSLDVNGEGVKLDHLGPLVVNVDGTMSRIANWAEMSEIERQNTLRILGKRNQLRLSKLKAQREDGAQEGM